METVTKPNMSAILPVAMGSALGELACYLLCLTVFELLDPLRALHKATKRLEQAEGVAKAESQEY